MKKEPKSKRKWKSVGTNLVRHVPSGTIYAYFRVKGRKLPVRRSIDTADLRTAQNKLPDIRREEEQKLTPAPKGATVTVAVEKYLATIQGLAKSTVAYRTAILNRFQRECPFTNAQDVTPSFLEGWLGKLIAAGKSSSTHNEHLMVVDGLFKMLVRDKVMTESPAKDLKWKKRERKIKLIPNEEQLALLIADMRAKKENRSFAESADFVEFMSLAGVGNGETAALKWKHVDFLNNEMHLFRLKTRSYFLRKLNNSVREFLLKRYEKSDKNGETNVFSIKNPRKAIENSCKRLQLPHYHNRTMRYYFITRALRKGIQPDVIARWQNHKDGGKLILDTYGQVTSERESEALHMLG
jgi:integrase